MPTRKGLVFLFVMGGFAKKLDTFIKFNRGETGFRYLKAKKKCVRLSSVCDDTLYTHPSREKAIKLCLTRMHSSRMRAGRS